MSEMVKVSPSKRLLGAILLLRPKQWTKNIFVLSPLLFTPEVLSRQTVLAEMLAFVAFCFASSSVYIVNDIMDREADRKHPAKCKRPIAAGLVPVWAATAMAPVCFVIALALASSLDSRAFWVLIVYLTMNLLYSLKLKHVAILDVMVISLGFVMRLVVGSMAIHVVPSTWLVHCVGLVALFLALAKRRDDLILKLGAEHRGSIRGYNLQFLDMAMSGTLFGILMLYIIYTAAPDVQAHLGTDKLYYTTPFVLAGILRYLQITLVEHRSGSPTDIVTSDRVILGLILGWFATLVYVVYL